MSRINLTTNDIRENKTANIQYSYPVASVSGTNPFLLNFYGLNQNFSASFTHNGSSIYISGVCVNATITKKSHILANDSTINAELVLEHKKSDNKTFYVVVPVILQNNSANPMELEPDSVFDLNAKIQKNKPKIVCYKTTRESYVFVFEEPVQINSSVTLQNSMNNVFNGIARFTIKISKKKETTTTTAFRASKGQNVQDEIECEYVTQTDTNAKPADKQMMTTILTWVFILFGVLLCLTYVLTLVSNRATEESANTIYIVMAAFGIILFITYIRMFTNTTSRKLQYGSMTILSIMTILMPMLAYNGFLKKPAIE
jgi:hypothetical protein